MFRMRFSPLAANLLLTALVVAWGSVPPAIRHGHEGGDDTRHRHHGHHANDQNARGHQECDAHWHHHDDGAHRHFHERSDESSRDISSVMLAGPIVHLHWGWLGFHLSLPVSQHEPSDDGCNGAEPVVLRLIDVLPTPTVGDCGVASHALSPAVPFGVIGFAAVPPLPRSPDLLPAAPLCDRARRERSGVLRV